MPNFSKNNLLECTGGLREVMSAATWIMCHFCSDDLIGLVLEYTLGWQKQECKVCHLVSLLYSPKTWAAYGRFRIFFRLHFIYHAKYYAKSSSECTVGLWGGHRFCFHNRESFLLWWPIGPSLWECARMAFMRTKEGKQVFWVYWWHNYVLSHKNINISTDIPFILFLSCLIPT